MSLNCGKKKKKKGQSFISPAVIFFDAHGTHILFIPVYLFIQKWQKVLGI